MLSLGVKAQVITNPFIGSRTHQTLKIDKIERTTSATVFHMYIENQRTDGEAWFCADKKIYIQESGKSEATRYQLIKSEGIPTCPDAHRFTRGGERLSFELHFPPIDASIMHIDLVENCFDNCFKLEEIALSPVFNEEVALFNKATTLYTSGKKAEALRYFTLLLNQSQFEKSKHFAYAHYIIPVIYHELGDVKNAEKWYHKLRETDINNQYYFIETIREIDFFAKFPK